VAAQGQFKNVKKSMNFMEKNSELKKIPEDRRETHIVSNRLLKEGQIVKVRKDGKLGKCIETVGMS
jgi:hypothetical protein